MRPPLLRLLHGLAVLLPFALASGAWGAQRAVVLTDAVQLGLGDAFMADGEYYRAATKFMEFLHLFPDSERTPYALLQIGMAHYRGGECEQAVEFFARVRATYPAEEFSAAAFFEGVCYTALDEPAEAQDAFERTLAFDDTGPYASDALIGKALSRIGPGDLRGGREELRRFQPIFPTNPKNTSVEAAVALIDTNLATPRKSAGLAATFSAVLPGSGQMYAGRYKDGLVALGVNGLFIAGTVVAIRHQNYPVAILVGGAGLPFYIGNIYGGANAAKKWNVSLNRTLHDTLILSLDYPY